jgi:polar amino acid transport system substrate-binding protein
MHPRWTRIPSALTALALWCGVAAHAECSRTLRYHVSDWQPYAFKTPIAEGRGIDVDILMAVAAKAGCKVEVLTEFPGARTHAMFQRGEIDVFTGYSFAEDRREFARFTRPYRFEVLGVFTMRKDLKPEAVTSFADVLDKQYHLVAPLSGYYGEAYANAEPELLQRKKLSKVEGPERALRMLAANRGDLVLNDAYVLQYTAKQLKLGPLQKMALEPSRDRIHIGLSKASTTEQDHRAIDQAVDALLRNGTIDKITRKYGIKAN